MFTVAYMTHCKRSLVLSTFLAVAAGCAGAVTRESLIPIPEHPPNQQMSPTVRGTARAAERISSEHEFAILGEVVRRFYRPMMQQARWIDPRPLAHERTRLADSLEKPDNDWAIAIAQAARLRRVCPLDEANEQCKGLAGGVLRFSPPYAVGTSGRDGADSALVYVRYTPVSYGVSGEIEFFMVRSGSAWRIASKRSLPEIAANAPGPAAQHEDLVTPHGARIIGRSEGVKRSMRYRSFPSAPR